VRREESKALFVSSKWISGEGRDTAGNGSLLFRKPDGIASKIPFKIISLASQKHGVDAGHPDGDLIAADIVGAVYGIALGSLFHDRKVDLFAAPEFKGNAIAREACNISPGDIAGSRFGFGPLIFSGVGVTGSRAAACKKRRYESNSKYF
jgi:hypothetical protein